MYVKSCTPIRYNFKSTNQNTKNEELPLRYTEKEYSKAKEEAKADGFVNGFFLAGTIGLFGALLSAGSDFNDALNDAKDRKEIFKSIMNNPDIKTDTFTIKDMNGDKSPELIFEKKDGSNVVLDLKYNKILK